MGSNDVKVNFRLPSQLLAALDAWAAAIGATRSAVLRGLVEDMADSGELPTVSPTPQEQLDTEFERLRELSRA